MVHRRDGDTWTLRVAMSGDRVEIRSLSAEVSIDDVYRNSSVR